jgi:hypothetical protein
LPQKIPILNKESRWLAIQRVSSRVDANLFY